MKKKILLPLLLLVPLIASCGNSNKQSENNSNNKEDIVVPETSNDYFYVERNSFRPNKSVFTKNEKLSFSFILNCNFDYKITNIKISNKSFSGPDVEIRDDLIFVDTDFLMTDDKTDFSLDSIDYKKDDKSLTYTPLNMSTTVYLKPHDVTDDIFGLDLCPSVDSIFIEEKDKALETFRLYVKLFKSEDVKIETKDAVMVNSKTYDLRLVETVDGQDKYEVVDFEKDFVSEIKSTGPFDIRFLSLKYSYKNEIKEYKNEISIVVKIKSKNNPDREYSEMKTFIDPHAIYNQKENHYFVFMYANNCPHCEEFNLKNTICNFALKNKVKTYFVGMKDIYSFDSVYNESQMAMSYEDLMSAKNSTSMSGFKTGVVPCMYVLDKKPEVLENQTHIEDVILGGDEIIKYVNAIK